MLNFCNAQGHVNCGLCILNTDDHVPMVPYITAPYGEVPPPLRGIRNHC